MKETATAFMQVELEKIACESNRKYTKDDSFDQLVSSIREHGIIEPPVLRPAGGDGAAAPYRVIAGRRRVDAARQLGHKAVGCIVMAEDDPRIDEEIALSENVNRLEMHPLDEAALFGRMAAKGAAVGEIARHYARSPSAIYKRLRLSSLTGELKGMFRDCKISIGSAAVLAELPESDQEQFYKEYGEKEWEIHEALVHQFVKKRQRFAVMEYMQGCGGCGTRTHNQGNELFDEFQCLSDVCLDADCYRRKWKALIEAALAERYDPDTPTDAKIWFSGGIPELLYKKATHVVFFNADTATEYEIINDKDYTFTGETKKKKGACLRITSGLGGITVQRTGYKLKPPKEAPKAGVRTNKEMNDLADGFGREALEAVAEERNTTAADLASALRDSKTADFQGDVHNLVRERVTARRIELEKSGAGPQCDYLNLFLQAAEEEMYTDVSFVNFDADPQRRKLLGDLAGKQSVAEITANLPDETQGLFHALLLSLDEFAYRSVPSLGDLKEKNFKRSKNLFWQYARMSEGEYRELYIAAAKEVAARALDPKPVKGKPKKAGAKGKGEAGRSGKGRKPRRR